jgi:acyl carrier protein
MNEEGMMSDSVTQTIADFVQQNFVYDDSPVDPSASFMESGLIDSTGILEVVFFLEETFGISVEDDDVLPEHFDSIVRLSAYVRRKLEGLPLELPAAS